MLRQEPTTNSISVRLRSRFGSSAFASLPLLASGMDSALEPETVSDEANEDSLEKVAATAAGEALFDDVMGSDFMQIPGGVEALEIGDSLEKVAGLVQTMMKASGGNLDVLAEANAKMAAAVQLRQAQQSEVGPEGKPEDEDAALWREMDEANFFFGTGGAKGNPMAGRWARFLRKDPEQKQKYLAITSFKAKSEFRQQWCKLKFQEYQEEKSMTKTMETISKKEGRYFSLGKIAQEEGGGKEGLQAALNYSVRAVSLGGEWIEFCEFTQQVKFLYFVKGYDEVFKKAWQTKQRWSNPSKISSSDPQPPTVATAPLAQPPSSSTAPLGSSVATVPTTPRPGKGAKNRNVVGDSGGGVGGAGDSGKKRGSSDMASAMTAAKKAKSEYNSAVSQSGTILRNIETDSSWKWASHESINGELNMAVDKLDELIQNNSFVKDAITGELVDLKTSYNSAELQTELTRFKNTVGPLVAKVSSAARVLVAQHKARISAAC
jgi:hypothetical protein